MKGDFVIPLDRLLKENLSLDGLTMPDLSRGAVHAIKNSAEREIGEYKAKYGDAWSERYLQDCCGDDDYSADMHTVNSAILYGTSLIGTRFFDMQETRMHELYGSQYDELRQHLARDERVVELLLADAVKTGKWRELPEELLSDYHKRTGQAV